MNENIVLFLKKLGDDAALQEQFKAITDPQVAYTLASSIQPGFTKEEFVEAMTKIKTQLDEQELTDEDLKKTAGGGIDLNGSLEDIELTPGNIAILAGSGAVMGAIYGAAMCAGVAAA